MAAYAQPAPMTSQNPLAMQGPGSWGFPGARPLSLNPFLQNILSTCFRVDFADKPKPTPLSRAMMSSRKKGWKNHPSSSYLSPDGVRHMLKINPALQRDLCSSPI